MYIRFGIISDLKITYILSTQSMYLSSHPSRRHCYSQDIVTAKKKIFKILCEIDLQSVWAQRDKTLCFMSQIKVELYSLIIHFILLAWS